MHIDKAYIEKNLLLKNDTSIEEDSSQRKPANKLKENPRNEQGSEGNNKNSEKAFRKIELLLSVRDRSILEIQRRLTREKFPEDAINEAIERALRCGYLDDDRFAEGFIRSRLRASKGIKGIVRDLKSHGIDAEQMPGFPEIYLEDQGSQLESALHLLRRKPPHSKNQRQAAYAKLMRNGYASSVASEAVKVWLKEQEEEMHFA